MNLDTLAALADIRDKKPYDTCIACPKAVAYSWKRVFTPPRGNQKANNGVHDLRSKSTVCIKHYRSKDRLAE